MPFFLRKSVSVGPFRFNLSKSGIGVSAGITGFRLGAGPRGRYIHAGRGGIYYRKTISSEPEGLLFQGGRPIDSTPATPPAQLRSLETIDSGAVLQMVDASSADLLKELNEKQHITSWWPAVLVCTAFLAIGLYSQNASLWISLPILVIGILLTAFVYSRDVLKKTVPMLYDLEPEVEELYKQLYEAFEEIKNVGRIWLIEGRSEVVEAKYQGGATQLVRRQPVSVTMGLPKLVKSNLEAPAIPVGKQTLYFFPDTLMVCEGKSYGAINYRDLKVDVTEGRFIEDEELPRDARIVGKTWKYVNKSGEPDKRFKDNREMPIVLYEQIRFSSSSGLNELLQVSQQEIGTKLKQVLADLGILTTTTGAIAR